ncbi:MAG: pyrroline-5-carboxylate reductase, partial [Firmicutes bacterium]|nr:pyrroline-5-carboxylate reductase [Bacillota bacterium]
MMGYKLGILGFGNMGSAIAEGALLKGVIKAGDVYVYNRSNPAMLKAEELGFNCVSSEDELWKASDIILLAIKPQFMAEALSSIKKTNKPRAVISVAAGLTTERLRAMMPGPVRILRTMPNTPVMVGEGMTALCEGSDLMPDELDLAEDIFKSIGLVQWIREDEINAVGALSGGAPAYAAMFIEALGDGGVKVGLKRDISYKLAAQALLGAAKMIIDMDIHPGELKDMVTSPKGTTIEAVETLEKGSFRYTVMDAVVKATEKAGK